MTNVTNIILPQVQFVDYGNIELCSKTDLRPANLLKDIPILTHRYCLAHLRANTKTGKWPRQTLDTIHKHIVEQVCSVTIVYDDILGEVDVTPINLKCGQIDITNMLLTNELALHSLQPVQTTDEKVDILYDAHDTSVTGRRNRQKLNVAQYKDIFKNREQEEEDLSRSLESPTIECAGVVHYDHYDDIIFEDDVIDHLSASIDAEPAAAVAAAAAEQSPSNSVTLDLDQSVSDLFDFQPDDTSTEISVKVNIDGINIFQHFKSINLYEMMLEDGAGDGAEAADPNRFLANCGAIYDSLNVWVFPQIAKHLDQHQRLMEDIQSVAELPDKMVRHIDCGMPVLARFSMDRQFYRGVVKQITADAAQILFVDYMDIEWVQRNDLRVCPKSLQHVPLRYVLVCLSGIRANPRMREVDVESKLIKLMDEAATIVVNIVDRRKVPLVELIENPRGRGEGKLMYQSMIKDKYYIKKSSAIM